MRFIIPINEASEDESQTLHIVETDSNCARTNKKKLTEYFIAVGVPRPRVKYVMKSMGFWGDALGGQHESEHKTTESITPIH